MNFIIHFRDQFATSVLILAVMVWVTLLLNLSFVWILSLPYSSPESPIFRGLRESVENRMVAEHYNCLRWIWAMCLMAVCSLVVSWAN